MNCNEIEKVSNDMTGYRVNTGASKKFVAGWDSIFGDVKPSSSKKKGKKDWKGKEKKVAAARPKVIRSEESKEEQEVV